MTDSNQQPQYNDAQNDEKRTPPHKGSKWRKKAGTDEAYEPAAPPDVAPDSQLDNSGRGENGNIASRNGYETAPPPDKAPGLTDVIDHKQNSDNSDDDDDEPVLKYNINLGSDSESVTSNAPNIGSQARRNNQDASDDNHDD